MKTLTDSELDKLSTMTAAYNKLCGCVKELKQLSEQFERDFKEPIETKGDYFYNPLSVDYDLEKQIDVLKEKITSFIYGYIEDSCGNLVIDYGDIQEYVGLDRPGFGDENRRVLTGPFTVVAVIDYIEQKYADVETITLEQLRGYVKHTLPKSDKYPYEPVTDVGKIPVFNKTGIVLRGSSYRNHHKQDPTAAIIKLINIELSDISPSKAEHHEIECGNTYSDKNIKSLRKFKNGKLKIVFFNKMDMNTVREMLVKTQVE